MNKNQSHPKNFHELEFRSKIFEVNDVNFPGDDTGNRIAFIEAKIKIESEYLQLNKELSDDLIITTTDKLKIQLNEYANINTGNKDLIAPVGTALSLIVALVTSDCRDAYGINADTWEALLIIFLILSIVWFIILLIKLTKNRDKRNINSLIKKIKKREPI